MTYEQTLEWLYETAFRFAGPDGPDNCKKALALRDRLMADAKDRRERIEGSETILQAADKVADACLLLILQPGNRDYEQEAHMALDEYAKAHGKRV